MPWLRTEVAIIIGLLLCLPQKVGGVYVCGVEVKADLHVSTPSCTFTGRSSASQGSLEHIFAVATGGGFSGSLSLVLCAVDLFLWALCQGWSWIVTVVEAIWLFFDGTNDDEMVKGSCSTMFAISIVALGATYLSCRRLSTSHPGKWSTSFFLAINMVPFLWLLGTIDDVLESTWPVFLPVSIVIAGTAFIFFKVKKADAIEYPRCWSACIFLFINSLPLVVWLGMCLVALVVPTTALIIATLAMGALTLALAVLIAFVATRLAGFWFLFLLLVGILLGCVVCAAAFLPLAALSVFLLGLLAAIVHRMAVRRERAAGDMSQALQEGRSMPTIRPSDTVRLREQMVIKAKKGFWMFVDILARGAEGVVEVLEFAANLSMTNAALLGLNDWNLFGNVQEHLATTLLEALPFLHDMEWLHSLLNGIEDAAYSMPTAFEWFNTELLGFDFRCPGASSMAPCCQLAAGLAVAYLVQRASALKAVLNRLIIESERFIVPRPLALVAFIIQQKSIELMVLAGPTVFIFSIRGAPQKDACDFEGDRIMTSITRFVLIVSSIACFVLAPRVALPNEQPHWLLPGDAEHLREEEEDDDVEESSTAGHPPRPLHRLIEFLKESGRLAMIVFKATFGYWTEEGLHEITRGIEGRRWFKDPRESRRYESYVQLSAQFASLPYQALPLGTLASKVMQATNAGFVMTRANEPRLPAVDALSKLEKFTAFVRAAMLVAIPLVPQDMKKVLIWIALVAILVGCLSNHYKRKPEPDSTLEEGDDFHLTDTVQRGLDRMSECCQRCSNRCWMRPSIEQMEYGSDSSKKRNTVRGAKSVLGTLDLGPLERKQPWAPAGAPAADSFAVAADHAPPPPRDVEALDGPGRARSDAPPDDAVPAERREGDGHLGFDGPAKAACVDDDQCPGGTCCDAPPHDDVVPAEREEGEADLATIVCVNRKSCRGSGPEEAWQSCPSSWKDFQEYHV